MGNVMSIGRSRAKAYSTDKPSTTFSDIAGYEGVKQEITEVVDFLRMPERFKEIGARVPKGILLVGPPGTGKTLFARAVAGEAGVGFLSVTGSDFMEMFVGVGASRVRDLFQQARTHGPGDHLHRRDRLDRPQARRRPRRRPRRARADAQPDAVRDGRLRDVRGHRHHGRHQPARHPRPGAAAPRPLRPPDRRAAARVRGAPRDPRGAQPRQADGPRRRPRDHGPGHARHGRRRPRQPRQRGGAHRRAPRVEADRADRLRERPRPRGARRPARVADPQRRGEAGHRLPRGRARAARHRAPPRRPAAQGHHPPPRHGARRHVEPAAGAPHVLQGVLRGHHLQGDGWPRGREDRVRPPQLGRRQRPRAVAPTSPAAWCASGA